MKGTLNSWKEAFQFEIYRVFLSVPRDYKPLYQETKGRTIMELFTDAGKLNFLTTRDVRCVPRVTRHTLNISSCQKKLFFFNFPVAVNNPIKVGPLIFLL
jgi:hypothetical protein